MEPVQDYLLVEEIIKDSVIEGTNLKTKYDDTERFMYVKVIKTSRDIIAEVSKLYKLPPNVKVQELARPYQVGNILIINRVAKTPYKDGQYFISIKDVIAVEEYATDTIPVHNITIKRTGAPDLNDLYEGMFAQQ